MRLPSSVARLIVGLTCTWIASVLPAQEPALLVDTRFTLASPGGELLARPAGGLPLTAPTSIDLAPGGSATMGTAPIGVLQPPYALIRGGGTTGSPASVAMTWALDGLHLTTGAYRIGGDVLARQTGKEGGCLAVRFSAPPATGTPPHATAMPAQVRFSAAAIVAGGGQDISAPYAADAPRHLDLLVDLDRMVWSMTLDGEAWVDETPMPDYFTRGAVAISGISWSGAGADASFALARLTMARIPPIPARPPVASPAIVDASVLKPDDRILFVGDSITGQGVTGWMHLIDEALHAIHPDWKPTLIPLGGSGHGVGTWQLIEKQSRTEHLTLDIKTIDVKDALDRPADVVVSMLGVNDVLCPRLRDQDADYDRWAANYGDLIQAIRDRIHPRVVALATPTPVTEDPASPKNVVMAALIGRLRSLAAKTGYVVLPTSETLWGILDEGRSYRPDFHVLGDSVHPNGAGHVAVAIGMLEGLGEHRAAAYLRDKRSFLWQRAEPSLSWRLERLPTPLETDRAAFRISYHRHGRYGAVPEPAPTTLALPEGWTITGSAATGPDGRFEVAGVPDHLENRLVLASGGQRSTVLIPAPWLIGTTSPGVSGWSGYEFTPSKQIFPDEAAITAGTVLGQPLKLLPSCSPLTWKRHIASVDYGGGATPGAIDIAGVSFYQTYDVAYGARWIHSDAERSLFVEVKPLGFVCGSYLALWINGEQRFSGPAGDGAFRLVPIVLRKGWNAVIFKSNHCQTQWQFSLNLMAGGADDLRVSTVPARPVD